MSGDALVYFETQSRQEWQKAHRAGFTLRETPARLQKMQDEFYGNPKQTPSLLAAVAAFEAYTNKQKQKEKHMNEVVKNENTSVSLAQKFGFTDSQLDLVKRTVAKNATNDELELFFYRCKELQLNPLMPGQVYFLKFGNAAGTIIIGLDGFRSRAQRTGKLAGIKRGVIRNDKGVCIGGWADVYRKDWDHPAHEEVALSEYADPRKQTWKDMPETMIKKVAEVAALRMAFPEELGGVYSREEMDQADRGNSIKDVESHSNAEPKPSMAQLKRLFTIAHNVDVDIEEIKAIVFKDYGKNSSKDLTIEQYNELCASLESRASKPQPAIEVPKVIIKEEEIAEPGSDFDEPTASASVPWAKYRESENR